MPVVLRSPEAEVGAPFAGGSARWMYLENQPVDAFCRSVDARFIILNLNAAKASDWSGVKEFDNDKAEKFLELFSVGREFTEELLRENGRLRNRVAALESAQASVRSIEEIEKLRARVEMLDSEKRTIQKRFDDAEELNREFLARYVEIEEQNNNLANLYVASYQLHSTLDFREVIDIVQEIIINLIGAESYAILLLDEKTNRFETIASGGGGRLSGLAELSVAAGEGVLGEAGLSGTSYYAGDELHSHEPAISRPIAVVPLKISDEVIGLISIFSLLEQKHTFTAVDYELFSLLAAHAAAAIFSSRLYSQSERKLSTIQSFLDLLTTT